MTIFKGPLLAALLLGLLFGGKARAYEFTPEWGYAFIDDAPFNDPEAGGALLPSARAFPRGWIRDTLVDGRDVRLTVSVSTAGNASAQTAYKIEEGDFQNLKIDRRLDISPFTVSYLRYDFCRFNPSNGTVDACEASVRIARPADPVPTPTAAPAPQDADGDGVAVPADCWDQNATVFPGAPEIPGNAIDDDCAGGDAPARLTATIQNIWTAGARHVRVNRLRVIEAPPGARVELACRGARCPFRRRFATVNTEGIAPLAKFFKRRLQPRITIEVRVTYPNTIGRVGRFRITRVAVPHMQRLCLPPGTTRPAHC